MVNLKLIKLAISEWRLNELSDKECINIISVIINMKHPSDEEMKWIKQEFVKSQGLEVY